MPGLPLPSPCHTASPKSQRVSWWDSSAPSGNATANGDTNNLKGWQMLPERGRRWRGIVLKHKDLPLPFSDPRLSEESFC